jgi:hypothetical protein
MNLASPRNRLNLGKHGLALAWGLILWCGSPAGLRADIILLEDNFNTENGGAPALNFANFGQWNVTRGTVDLIGPGLYDFYAGQGHGLYVDLDGSRLQGGRLESKAAFDLAPGNYELQFDIANNGGPLGLDLNLARVSVGDVYNEFLIRMGFPNPRAFTTVTRGITVAAATSGRLVFDQFGGDDWGIIIDNVRLRQLTPGTSEPPVRVTSTPAPGALVLAVTGLPLLVGYGWRRKRVA